MQEHVRVPLLRMSTVTLGRAACVLVVAGAAHLVVRASGSAGAGRGVWLAASVVLAAVVIASRSPLDRLADRVAYGASGDPHSRLSGFVERISDTLAVDDVLPRVAQTVTQATHSDRSDVRLWLGDGVEVREVWPPASAESKGAVVDVPLRHHGDQVGVLGVATDRQSLTADSRELLDRLAGTAGLALANVRLTYDLRRRLAESRDLAGHLERSRRRLLAAEAEQTERFSGLVEQRVRQRLYAVGRLLDRAQAGDATALEEGWRTTTSALEALRDIAAGVFPPALADSGLRVAMETYSLRYDGRVTIAHRGLDHRVAAPVEAAAYLCAVRLVEDCAAAAGRVHVDLEQLGERLCVRVHADRAASSATMQLVTDRVEATGGVLDPSTHAAVTGTSTVLERPRAATTVLCWSTAAPDPTGAPA